MGQDSQNTEYLYDFIYVDTDRLSSLACQLFPNGKITSYKETISKSEQLTESDNSGVGGKFNAGIASITATKGNDRKNTETSSKNGEMLFDTEWALPLMVIDKLDEIGFLGKEINNANYGQLFISKGSIQISDLAIIKDFWPVLGKVFGLGQKGKTKTDLNNKQIVDILCALPHTLQFSMTTNQNEILWSTLPHKNMVINPLDFSLKHGNTISGEWVCLGMLDAKPYDDAQTNEDATPQSLLEMQSTFMSLLKPILGRKDGDYGVSPILIFRLAR